MILNGKKFFLVSYHNYYLSKYFYTTSSRLTFFSLQKDGCYFPLWVFQLFTVCWSCSLELPNLKGQGTTWKNNSAVNTSILFNNERKQEKTAVSTLRWPFCCFRTISLTRIPRGFFMKKRQLVFHVWVRRTHSVKNILSKNLSVGFANKTPGYNLDIFRPPTVRKIISEKLPFYKPSKLFFYNFFSQSFLFFDIVNNFCWKKQLSVSRLKKRNFLFGKCKLFFKEDFFCTFFEEITITFAFCWAKFASILSQKKSILKSRNWQVTVENFPW